MAEGMPGKTGKRIRILLFTSLALNLLIIGAMAGAVLSGGKWWHNCPPRLETAGGPLTRALSKEDRRAIGHKMREAYRNKDIPHTRHGEEFAGLIEDLKATPFDPQAVEARLATIRGLFRQRLTLGQSLLIERLAGMSDAERADYAERLQQTMRHRRH